MLTPSHVLSVIERDLGVSKLRLRETFDPVIQREEVDGRVYEFECPVFEWEVDGKRHAGAVPVAIEIVTRGAPPWVGFPKYRRPRQDAVRTMKNLAAMIEQSRSVVTQLTEPAMSYDHWKTTDPADESLGPEPSHEELVGLYGEEALELAGMEQMPPVSGESDKLKTAVAAFVAMGWTEEEARKIVDDTLRDAAPQGSG